MDTETNRDVTDEVMHTTPNVPMPTMGTRGTEPSSVVPNIRLLEEMLDWNAV